MLTSRSNGNTDCAISSVSGHPGRSGCGTSSRASTATASTAFVDGAITPVRMLRVATSTAIVSSARRVTPSAYRHRMSIVFVSICTCSPGRSSTEEVNGRSGRLSVRPSGRRRAEGVPAAVQQRRQPIQLPVARDPQRITVLGRQRATAPG